MTELTPGLLANALADTIQATSRLLVNTTNFSAFNEYFSDTVILTREQLNSSMSVPMYDFIAGDMGIKKIQTNENRIGFVEYRFFISIYF